MGRLEVKPGFWIVAALWLLLFPVRFAAGVWTAAAVHEAGHVLAIYLTGGRIRGFELRADGARIVTAPMGPGAELVCALAGPVAGGCTLLLWRWFPEAAVAGLLQTVFNLLPIYPLDGGRAVAAVRNICCK